MVAAPKVALVTGSTDGVGRYVAGKLAANGMKVLIHGRDRARAESLVRSVRDAGARRASLPRLTLPPWQPCAENGPKPCNGITIAWTC